MAVSQFRGGALFQIRARLAIVYVRLPSCFTLGRARHDLGVNAIDLCYLGWRLSQIEPRAGRLPSPERSQLGSY